jgi:glycosyltransferase involved in cell wall biosynthesis
LKKRESKKQHKSIKNLAKISSSDEEIKFDSRFHKNSRGEIKMKVCHLTSVHSPFDSRIFYKECKTLVEAGYKVTLIAQHDKNEVVSGVEIIALPKAKNRVHRMFGLTLKIFWLALKQKADLYHFHDPELMFIGVALKLFTGKRVIYDVHENVRKQILNKYWLPKWSRKIVSILYGWIEKLCLLFIDYIIIAEDSYIENYIKLNNVKCVKNFPLLSYLKNQNCEANYSQEIIEKSLIYLGCISKPRGVFELIKAVKLLKDYGYSNVLLKLIGPVYPESLLLEVNELLSRYNISNNITIFGKIPHEKVYEILSESRVGLAILHPDPNYIESFPTKLFEYMATGLPVVVSNFPLWKEIINAHKCGICVDPLNPEEIAKAIRYLIEHPKLAKKMGENGRKAVLEKYNWEREGRKLLALYRRIGKSEKN